MIIQDTSTLIRIYDFNVPNELNDPNDPNVLNEIDQINQINEINEIDEIISCLCTNVPLDLFHAAHPGRLKDEDICYNNKMMKQIEYDER